MSADLAAGDMTPVVIRDMFDYQRVPSSLTQFLLILYFPIGLVLFVLRCFIGAHVFLVGCLLRKSNVLRSNVLRAMCAVLGVVVMESGERDAKTRLYCANHVSSLDHLAVDLLSPCLLPSVWDIPSVVRWCFGYTDLGATSGRATLVANAKKHLEAEQLPLLSFPEGAITNGKKAILKFSFVQPVAVRLWRPFGVEAAVLGSLWWTDVFWFMALPFTIFHVNYLPVIRRTESETAEDMAARVARSIASNLGLRVSNLTNSDAVEAAKRYVMKSALVQKPQQKLDPRQLDHYAMRIKQSHPTVSLWAIRMDLDRCRSPNITIERIKQGKLTDEDVKSQLAVDSTNWKKVYEKRKWEMIDCNRAKYLMRMQKETTEE